MTVEEPMESPDLLFHATHLSSAVKATRELLLNPASRSTTVTDLEAIEKFADYARRHDAVESKCLALLGPALEASTRLGQTLDHDPPLAKPGWIQELGTITQSLDEIQRLLVS